MNLDKQPGEQIEVTVEIPTSVVVILVIIIMELGAIFYSLHQQHVNTQMMAEKIAMISEHTHDVIFDKDIVITFEDSGLVGKIEDSINE